MASGLKIERNQEATIYVAGLDEKVTETLLCELFTQAAPVVNVYIPKDRITHLHQGYGFVEFSNEHDADYAIKIMNMIKLYSKPIKVNKASAHQRNSDVGANLFISNLSHDIDEKLLYDIFSAFGVISQAPKIIRDPDTGNSKGYAFVHFANFEASDTAIELMNGQHICNQQILVSYAFKKNSKCEKHGTAAERLLAARNPLSYTDRPNQMFADTDEIHRIFGQMVPLFPTEAAQPPPPPIPSLPSLPPLPPPSIRSPMSQLPFKPPGLSVTNQMICYNAFPPILPTLPLQQLPSQLPNGNFSQF